MTTGEKEVRNKEYLSTKRDGAQTKAAAAEVEEVGQDLRSAKHRLLRPVCVEGRAKDSKKVRVRL